MAVMGLKTGTKAFSDAPQNEIAKSDRLKTMSAHDMSALGEEDIGSTLNRISDPNWVDPSKRIRTAGNDQLDKDAFMKLMLAQMKHQDPMNPMKSHEMAAQLAQFSSVEQLQNINTNIESLRAAQKPTESFQALNFIGKAVSGDSSQVLRGKGDVDHEVSFNLGANAQETEVRVRNAQGEVVRSVKLTDLKQGINSWTWNGQDETGTVLPAGEYKIFIDAKDAGRRVSVKTDFDGVITGVNYTPEGPVLLVGNQSVKLKDVKKIIDPSLANKGQKAQAPVNSDLQQQQDAANMNVKRQGAPGADEVMSSNLMTDIGMSRDMMSKVQKETSSQ